METELLTVERMEQILLAKSDDEAVKLLRENGYPAMSLDSPESMDAAIAQAREETMLDLGGAAPDKGFVEIFQLKYDYHNAKALLKSRAKGQDPGRMLSNLGRVPAADLEEALSSGDRQDLPPLLAAGIADAKDVLDTTRDPQLSDIQLDRWMYREMQDVAEGTGSKFLYGWVQISIDAENLRTLVRTLRMGKNAAFLGEALFDGGTLATSEILLVAGNGGNGLAELYAASSLAQAAQEGADALKGGSLTDFEKSCDDAVSQYLSASQMVAFGEEPLIGYLAAKETEYTNLRIVLMGRSAGLGADIIRSRLRT
jgi:V/A-type H+-transporting ATPase subunit C